MLKRRVAEEENEIEERNELPLHLKYRPKSFKTFVGNAAMVKSLTSILKKDRVQAFMFSGNPGCGKTSLGRIIKNYYKCSEKDFFEYDMGSEGKVAAIREIIENARFFPLFGKYKIYMLDECHMLSTEGANALLKILEEPPKHIKFILSTTNPGKVITTIKQRCSKFTVSPLKPVELLDLLERVCEKEGIELSDKIMKTLIMNSEGSARNALVTLDQISQVEDDDEIKIAIIEGTISSADEANVIDLCRILLANKGWQEISSLLSKITVEPEKVRQTVLSYSNKVLLGKDNRRAATMIKLFSEPFFNSNRAGLTLACYNLGRER